MPGLEEITGKAISGEWGTDAEEGEGIPVLRTTNFTNDGMISYENVVRRTIEKKNLSDKFLRPGDIILEKSGGSDKQPVGRVVYYDGPEETYLFNNFTGLLRVKDANQWIPKYVFYALFANYAHGGTRQYENQTTGIHNLKTDQYVRDTVIPEKPLAEQRAIVSVFDEINRLLTLHKQQFSKLDKLLKARFVELFGDPVKNEKRWTLVPLGDVAEIRIGPFGSLLHKEDYIDGGHALVNPSHIVNDKIVTDEKLTVSDEKYAALSAYKLRKDDIVLGRRGEMGRCAVVHQDGLLCGTGSMIIRPNGEILPYFLQKMLSSPSYRTIIENKAVGTTMMNLNVPIVSSLMLPRLPKRQQEKYIAFVHQSDKSKLTVQKSIDKLETLKNILMWEI